VGDHEVVADQSITQLTSLGTPHPFNALLTVVDLSSDRLMSILFVKRFSAFCRAKRLVSSANAASASTSLN
jgi:hypothetical protein